MASILAPLGRQLILIARKRAGGREYIPIGHCVPGRLLTSTYMVRGGTGRECKRGCDGGMYVRERPLSSDTGERDDASAEVPSAKSAVDWERRERRRT